MFESTSNTTTAAKYQDPIFFDPNAPEGRPHVLTEEQIELAKAGEGVDKEKHKLVDCVTTFFHKVAETHATDATLRGAHEGFSRTNIATLKIIKSRRLGHVPIAHLGHASIVPFMICA
jgi:hypothetical protein